MSNDGIDYTINAIETRYEGVNFRSRLEAKWAAMFDLLAWKWTYEPTDFQGWIPDFAIHGHTVTYVEVKPVDKFPRDVAAKIDASGCDSETLIVGLGPFDCHGWPVIGWLNGKYWETGSPYWGEACLGRRNTFTCPVIGFCHSDESFTDRITGDYNGSPGNPINAGEITRLWREAGNRTRWKKR